MLLKSIHLTDFLSHADSRVDFRPDAHVLFGGPSGVGKSSCMEAIVWALYGIGRSTTNNGQVRKGQKKAVVELVLAGKGVTWTITRSVTSKGVQGIEIKGLNDDGTDVSVPATSTKEKNLFIEKEIVRASYSLFINGPYWRQNSSSSFTSLSPSERKDLLLEIAGYYSVEELDAKAKEWVSKSEARVSDIATEIRVGEVSIETDRNTVREFDEQKDYDSDDHAFKFDVLETDIADDEKALPFVVLMAQEATAKLNAAEKRRSERAVLSASVPELKTAGEVQAWQEELSGLGERITLIEAQKLVLTGLEASRTAAEEYRHKKSVLEANVTKYSESVTNYKSQMDSLVVRLAAVDSTVDTCPEGKADCHCLAKSKEAAERRKAEILGDISNVCKSVDMYQKMHDAALEGLNALVTVTYDAEQYVRIKNSIADESQVRTRSDMLRMFIEGNERDAKKAADIMLKLKELTELDVTGVDEAIIEHNGVIVFLRDRIASNKVFLERLKGEKTAWELKKKAYSEAFDRIKAYDDKTRNLKNESDVLSAKVSDVKLLREAFGANGIKAVIVDTLLPRIESKANEVLSELGDMRIFLDTQQAKSSGEGVKEGLFLTVKNGQGEEVPFENLSGGESLRCSAAIFESLASLQNCQFRMLDELVNGLDQESTSDFIEVLNKLQSRYSQVLAVSHIPEIQQTFSDVITIEKKDGISRIK